MGQCNPDNTKAYHAGASISYDNVPARNSNDQIGVSMVARAHKMPYQDQPVEVAALDSVLDHVAQLAVLINDRYGVPLQRITKEEYLAGSRGWLGHMDVARLLAASRIRVSIFRGMCCLIRCLG